MEVFLSLNMTLAIFSLPIAFAFIFGNREREKKITSISWSVPVPQDLLSQLRQFSPVAISRVSGIYLDDVFDLMKGNRPRTAPEIIEKLEQTLKTLRERDAELEREAAKIGFMIKGLDALDQQDALRKTAPKKSLESGKK
jgi:hypothetical protein